MIYEIATDEEVKALHKTKDVNDLFCRAIITLADSSRHNGTIYRCCNFKYYGLTDWKTDFYSEDGRKNPRCKTFWVHGVWLPRTQKHRYAYILDKSLVCNYPEQPNPSYDKLGLTCCKGTKRVYDNRFHEWWTCPICCGKMEKVENAESSTVLQ